VTDIIRKWKAAKSELYGHVDNEIARMCMQNLHQSNAYSPRNRLARMRRAAAGAARISCGGADCLSKCEALGSPLADSTNLSVIHALGFWAL